MGFLRVLSPDAAGRALLTLIVLAHAAAFSWLRARFSLHLAWAVVFGMSLFFVEGFFNFQLGFALGLMFFALADGGLHSLWRFAVALLLATLTYFCHAEPFALFGGAAILCALWRRDFSTAAMAALALLPGAALLVAFLNLPETAALDWSTRSVPPVLWWTYPAVKVAGIFMTCMPYSYVLGLAKLGVLGWLIAKLWRAPVGNRALALCAAASLVLFYVVPYDIGHVTYQLDTRCLPFALLFFLLGKNLVGDWARVAAKASVALALLTLSEQAVYFTHWSARATELNAVVDAAPVGARVLPVIGLHALGRVNPLIHLPARELTRGASYYPYLFRYRYHLIREREYPGRIPLADLNTPWNQVGFDDANCDDLYSPTGGVGTLAMPLVAIDKAIECIPWKSRAVAGGKAGQFPDIAAVAPSFDGLILLDVNSVLTSQLGALGRIVVRNGAGAYVTLVR